tara:strand:- start:91 stop:498 length:408 start_codon:yes stop_codon:yes gene_type:complete
MAHVNDGARDISKPDFPVVAVTNSSSMNETENPQEVLVSQRCRLRGYVISRSYVWFKLYDCDDVNDTDDNVNLKLQYSDFNTQQWRMWQDVMLPDRGILFKTGIVLKRVATPGGETVDANNNLLDPHDLNLLVEE